MREQVHREKHNRPRILVSFVTREILTIKRPLRAQRFHSRGRGQGMGGTGLTATDEQAAIVEAGLSGADLAIEALAGTGKTSTLRMLSAAVPHMKGQYIAFNKAIVTDARASFPTKVTCSTAHGLAFSVVGVRYQHRLASRRLTNLEMAGWMRCQPFHYWHSGKQHVLNDDQVARYALAMVHSFCKTDDPVISARHAPRLPLIADSSDVAAGFAEHLLGYARFLWADIEKVDGQAQFSHDYYLKMWQLSSPTIHADYIMFDEAQDADPVMLSVVNDQDHAQLVYCGDDFQTLYEWRGARNALSLANVDQRLWLTQSFRFGSAVASMANGFLKRLKAPKPLRGLPTIDSKVGPISAPHAILCRTNGGVFEELVDARRTGRRAAVVGGVAELTSFAKACAALQRGGRTNHPELAPFESWSEVLEWIDHNPEQSPDVAQKVMIVAKHGAGQIEALLKEAVTEAAADVTICTVHQSKGREWPTVRLADDFPHPDDMKVDQLRVGYVAVTRGRYGLDVGTLLSQEPKPSAQSRTPGTGERSARTPRKRPPIGGGQVSPTSKNAPALRAPTPQFAPGDRVFHGTLGSGTVVAVSGTGPSETCHAKFRTDKVWPLSVSDKNLRKML
jgi:hypothetical protein